jgi:metal-responsive CopG/Arc/MetJ family transcriptional regulator
MILKNGYKIREEKKIDIFYCRMDNAMLKQLQEIKEATGISKSEIVREAVRRLITDTNQTGEMKLTI